MTLLITGMANLLIGGLIGICGIAGFLLPILYTNILGYDMDYALAFSFLAFLISGILGSVNYHKTGNLDIRLSLRLGAGSFAGSFAGVLLQAMISKQNAKIILYIVVLFSGLSILYRIYSEARIQKLKHHTSETSASPKPYVENPVFLCLLGLGTGAICALSGAGGPVLVMPLLVTLGVSARLAVGIALFDSIFIALPACFGYLSRINLTENLPMAAVIILTHGLGVLTGSRLAGKVPVNGLKLFVAVFSVLISLYMLV